MKDTIVRVEDIAPLEHDAAIQRAAEEYERVIAQAETLDPAAWSQGTVCAAWDVKALLAHLLGMMERFCDPEEAARQDGAAGERSAAQGIARIDALTGFQVEQRAHLTTDELLAAMRAAAPRALAGRDVPPEVRAMPFDPGPPFEGQWTLGYLLDVILTRDPWMHRVDIADATATGLVLTSDHDGCLVADVVRDWAQRHGQPFNLVLDGPAGGTFVYGDGGDEYRLDAVEYCRVLSGRGDGDGLLAHAVPF